MRELCVKLELSSPRTINSPWVRKEMSSSASVAAKLLLPLLRALENFRCLIVVDNLGSLLGDQSSEFIPYLSGGSPTLKKGAQGGFLIEVSTLIKTLIQTTTNATKIHPPITLQTLWSGYGSIDRYPLTGAAQNAVIVKHVRLPDRSQHPRGWNTNQSHQRKLHSYHVETAWYRDWVVRCTADCRVPKSLALEQSDNEFIIVLEDLKDSGFPVVKSHATLQDMQLCLHWLANFHAIFMGATQPTYGKPAPTGILLPVRMN